MFDPRRMCWIKVDRSARDPLSPSADSLDEDDDPFAGLEDLVDATTSNKDGHGVSQGGKNGRGAGGDEWLVGEEFDLGPDFIRRQREEEVAWRRRVEAWVGPRRDMLGEFWRWKIRDMAPQLSL